MTHYHVMAGPMTSIMPTNLKFDSYEDSVATYLKIAIAVFEGRYDDDKLNIEKVVESTIDSEGIYMGIPSMSVLWKPCEEAPCSPAVWN